MHEHDRTSHGGDTPSPCDEFATVRCRSTAAPRSRRTLTGPSSAATDRRLRLRRVRQRARRGDARGADDEEGPGPLRALLDGQRRRHRAGRLRSRSSAGRRLRGRRRYRRRREPRSERAADAPWPVSRGRGAHRGRPAPAARRRSRNPSRPGRVTARRCSSTMSGRAPCAPRDRSPAGRRPDTARGPRAGTR